MKYRISKVADDSRSGVCGIVLPDGFERIMDLTRYNGRNLLHAESCGYTVEELPDDDVTPSGLYWLATGKRVTDRSALSFFDKRPGSPEAPEEAPKDYLDPASLLGLPPDKKAVKLGRAAKRADPSGVARGQRINRAALEQIAEEQQAAASLGVRRGVR